MIPDTPSIERLSGLLTDRTPSYDLEPESTVPTDAVFSILSHRHRRYALAYLLEQDRPVTVESIVSHVVDRTDSTGEGASNRITLRFHHGHFPKLVDAGLIKYDEERRIVAPTDATAALAPHLELASA